MRSAPNYDSYYGRTCALWWHAFVATRGAWWRAVMRDMMCSSMLRRAHFWLHSDFLRLTATFHSDIPLSTFENFESFSKLFRNSYETFSKLRLKTVTQKCQSKLSLKTVSQNVVLKLWLETVTPNFNSQPWLHLWAVRCSALQVPFCQLWAVLCSVLHRTWCQLWAVTRSALQNAFRH